MNIWILYTSVLFQNDDLSGYKFRMFQDINVQIFKVGKFLDVKLFKYIVCESNEGDNERYYRFYKWCLDT